MGGEKLKGWWGGERVQKNVQILSEKQKVLVAGWALVRNLLQKAVSVCCTVTDNKVTCWISMAFGCLSFKASGINQIEIYFMTGVQIIIWNTFLSH